MGDGVRSSDDLVLEANADGTGDGDIRFVTSGVERARIKADGTGTGWANVIGGSQPFADTYLELIEERRKSALSDLFIAEGQAAVAFCWDDCVTSDNSDIKPLFRDLGIPATSAANPGLIGTSGRVTWAQLKDMRDHGFEVAHHSVTHPVTAALPDLATFIAEMIAGADTLAAADGSYGIRVDSFVQPGTVSSGPYNIDSASKADMTDAGRYLRSRFALATDYVVDSRGGNVISLPSSRKYGAGRAGFNVVTDSLATVQARVAEARGKSALAVCGTHSALIGTGGGNNSLATVTTIMNWLAAQRDAGNIEFFTLLGGYHVKVSPDGRRNLNSSPFLLDALGNPRGWFSYGAPALTADAPAGGNSATCATGSDIVQLQIPCKSLAGAVIVRFKAKNAAPGVTANAYAEASSFDELGATTNYINPLTGAGWAPGWPATLSDNWQTLQFAFAPDGRGNQCAFNLRFSNNAGVVGAVKYADWEVYSA